jgi:hypothetical protein
MWIVSSSPLADARRSRGTLPRTVLLWRLHTVLRDPIPAGKQNPPLARIACSLQPRSSGPSRKACWATTDSPPRVFSYYLASAEYLPTRTGMSVTCERVIRAPVGPVASGSLGHDSFGECQGKRGPRRWSSVISPSEGAVLGLITSGAFYLEATDSQGQNPSILSDSVFFWNRVRTHHPLTSLLICPQD